MKIIQIVVNPESEFNGREIIGLSDDSKLYYWDEVLGWVLVKTK